MDQTYGAASAATGVHTRQRHQSGHLSSPAQPRSSLSSTHLDQQPGQGPVDRDHDQLKVGPQPDTALAKGTLTLSMKQGRLGD
jgi:hypothetical protein